MKISDYAFNDLRIGQKSIYVFDLNEQHIEKFSKLTGDFHPLHSSKDFAKQAGFKSIIAHGLLISSISSKLIGMDIPGKNAILISQSFSYNKPAYPQDKLRYQAEIVNLDKRFLVVKIKVDVHNDDRIHIANGIFTLKFHPPRKKSI